MADSYSSKLQIWEGWVPAVVKGQPPPSPGFRPPPEFTNRLYEGEALHTDAPQSHEGAEPFTLQWYLDIENIRHSRHGGWLPRLLEFAKHRGETLLGLGNGLGTDWVQYARHGAEVVACSPSAEQLALIRRNFELRGLGGKFLHASPTALPLEAASIDVVCVTSLLHEINDPRLVVEEVYRVLKPGGKVLAITPARYDVDFWCRRCLPWGRWLRPRYRGVLPAHVCFTAHSLRQLFARFVEPRVHKRHLRRRDVPRLWRWLPLPLLERLVGRVLVFKAFKPLSAAMALQAAA
jgi:ubiquinone/menaquinone biosynthesis C-methylase UbiE